MIGEDDPREAHPSNVGTGADPLSTARQRVEEIGDHAARALPDKAMRGHEYFGWVLAVLAAVLTAVIEVSILAMPEGHSPVPSAQTTHVSR
jgi:hypothetical protein